jgi:xanthine dehydrogenase YagR molybdenum-binding subunit
MAEMKKLAIGFPGDRKEIQVDVPAGEPTPWDLNTEFKVLGKHLPRVDGLAKATGTARYTHDVILPGMRHGMILRSPHAKAKILSIDTEAARRLPGVRAVWTAKAGSYVLHHGDEVAAVAADTLDIAEDALELIRVEYAVEPHAVTIEDAMKPDAPPVLAGQKRGNVRGKADEKKRREVASAIQASDVAWEGTFRTQVQVHNPLEAHGTVCRWDGDKKLTVWASTQATFRVRQGLARHLRLEQSNVRVITRHMGGGFGSKLGASYDMVICAELARRAKAPVKLMCDRKGDQLATGNRPNSIQKMKVGVSKAGKIQAISAVSWGTAGISGRGAGARNTQIYKFPKVYKEHHEVLTNNGAAAPFRAPGFPQGIFALESTLDMAAHALGMDPLAFRALNDPSPVRAAERKIGAERIGWARRSGAKPSPETVVRGIGYAATVWGDYGRPPSEVGIEITSDGRVLVINGAQDIGTGTRTLMAMVAAEEFGVPVGLVSTRLGDTGDGVGPTSGGSQTAAGLSPAVRSAAFKAKQALLQIAAGALEVAAEDLEITDGRIRLKNDPKKSAAWKTICAEIPGGKLTALGKRLKNFQKYVDGVAGCQFAEVEVDQETGVIRVVKVVAVQDCGTPLNRLTIENQIIGGVIQGVAYALREERILDREAGRVMNTDLLDYKIDGSLDAPEIEPIIFDVCNGGNNIGNAGMGEPPTIPTAAAIANAVFDATGVRCYELPMTPMRVLQALARKGV